MNRRDALRSASSLFGLAATKTALAQSPLPEAQLYAQNPEAYWKRLREEQFLLPDGRAYLNNGSLGVAPKPVVAAVTDYLTRGAALTVDGYPRWGYETLDDHRAKLAAYSGCHKDELALVHNATEAMSTIAAGLDLRAGDEVLMTDQEHPSGKAGWAVRQARHGVAVREVKIPLPPKSAADLADRMISSIGPRTKVLSFSGILTTTGLIMPVREICAAASAKGVLTVVDGAHMHGQVPFQLHDLNCDFFAGSPHKWLFAPAGCGLLYIREENLDRLWPTVVTGGWDDRNAKAARFMKVGTNNRAVFEGMMAGLQFHQAIGSERIYHRTHQLAKQVYDRARTLPYVEMLTPEDQSMYGALVTFRVTRNWDQLWKKTQERKIWIMGSPQLRVSTHIHTRPQDLDAFFETLREVMT